jgi:hypothetical protein
VAGRVVDYGGGPDLLDRLQDAGLPAGTTAGTPVLRSARQIGPNEETFLIELDAALSGPGVAELQVIDELTPRIMEIGMYDFTAPFGR